MIRSFWLPFVFVSASFGQELLPFSQHYLSKPLLNPAAVGFSDDVNVLAYFRNEWTSMPGAPKAYMLLADMPINHQSMGLGIKLAQFSIVANSNLYAQLMYSYKIKVANGKLGFGMQAGIARYGFDPEQIAIKDVDDALLTNASIRKIFPTLDVGIFYARKSWTLGFSAFDLLTHPYSTFNSEKSTSSISPTYILIGSRNSRLGKDWGIENQLSVLSWQSHTWLMYASSVVDYKKALYFGAACKKPLTLAIIIGITLDRISASLENCRVGYSYDFNLSKSSPYLRNTHEISLKINFKPPRNVKKATQQPEEISPYDL